MIAEGELEYSPSCSPKQTEVVDEKRGFAISVLNIENIVSCFLIL